MGIFSNNSADKDIDISKIKLPEHLGIIMDGNGRWAKKRGLPRSLGHSEGAKTFRTITRYCSDIGIKHLTMYAFSTENWNRPIEEVSALMKYFKDYLEEALRDFLDDTVKVKFIGDISAFPKELQELMIENERVSADRTGMVLNLAMNYGGRAELVTAFQKIAERVASGEISPQDISEKMISDSINIDVDPLFVVSDNLSGVHAAENAAWSAILGLGSVAVEEAEMNLTFVTVHLFAGNAAEKDSRVESFAVDVDVGSLPDALELNEHLALHRFRRQGEHLAIPHDGVRQVDNILAEGLVTIKGIRQCDPLPITMVE